MKRNILTAFLSLFIAFGLWLYVITVVSPNSDNTYNGVSVVLQGEAVLEERGLMIITRQIPTVSLRLEGNRSELQKLNSSNISITVDVSKIVEPGEHSLAISPNNIRLPGDVSYNAITVASRNPDYIKLEVRKRENKAVPVQVEFTGAEQDAYTTEKGNLALDFTEIQVSGPADVVSKIATAKVAIDLTNKSGTVEEELPFTLCDENGEPVDAELITTDTGSVKVTVRILQVKQLKLEVTVVNGGGATKETAKIEMSHSVIEVTGDEESLKDLETIDLGTIELGDLTEETNNLTFDVELPEGVESISENDEVVLVTVTFPDLATKTLQITKYVATNLPEGKKAEFPTEPMEVIFRGPKALIETLAIEHVTVTVDFSGADEGQNDLRAVVTLSGDYVQAGVVGEYFVSAIMS